MIGREVFLSSGQTACHCVLIVRGVMLPVLGMWAVIWTKAPFTHGFSTKAIYLFFPPPGPDNFKNHSRVCHLAKLIARFSFFDHYHFVSTECLESDLKPWLKLTFSAAAMVDSSTRRTRKHQPAVKWSRWRWSAPKETRAENRQLVYLMNIGWPSSILYLVALTLFDCISQISTGEA